MTSAHHRPHPHDYRIECRDVLSGLAKVQKSIPCTWLYDHRGSELFEEITRVPEYYPTRTEIMILERCAKHIGTERIKFLPFATLCIKCQELAEIRRKEDEDELSELLETEEVQEAD